MPGTGEYLVIGAIAAVVTFAVTPLVIRVAKKMGWVVAPDERRVHTVVTPDVGGIAMFVGFIAAFAAARLWDAFDPLFARNSEPRGVLYAAALMFLIGFVDDIREISAPAKVVGTVVVGAILVYFGVTMFYFRVPFVDVFILSDQWIPLVTVLWLLGMTTAINLIDGLDGLAAGIVAIGAGSFFLYAQRLADPSVGLLPQPNIGPLVAILAVGMCLGFLPHNWFPARIFMGDTGSMMLGLLLAASTITLSGQVDPNALEGTTLLPALLPILLPAAVMTIPLVDLALAVVRRTRAGRNPFAPDKRHLHHRLLEMGHSQSRAVLLMYAWTALIAGTALALAFVPIPVALLIFAAGLALLVVLVRRPAAAAPADPVPARRSA